MKMTEKGCFEFGFHPTFFTFGIVCELPLLSLNQNFFLKMKWMALVLPIGI